MLGIALFCEYISEHILLFLLATHYYIHETNKIYVLAPETALTTSCALPCRILLTPASFRDPDYKDILQAMVSSYVDKTAGIEDLVAGKGAGLVALLHGPPGTGKTLTAECVADSFEKPLYQVTCGDIGTHPSDLENRLEEIFEYAVTWGAILLLDEADVFLQERDQFDIQRNALVSGRSLPATPPPESFMKGE